LPQQFECPYCCYYSWKGFMKCAAEMCSGGTIYISSSMITSSGI
jgi:hypothetical protein